MLQFVDARKNKSSLFTGRLLHERRIRSSHFIGERRNRQTYRKIYLNTFLFVITTFSVGVWLALVHIPPQYAAPLLLFHLASLTAILLIKPYRRQPLNL